ncbi:SAV_2336 N-terminal domain-related protein [Streptomyces sp. NBC_01615]|uniref:SAV_2336 N-terminal domain-related protein n=1 Tax=Streptomyces sp. NBC_01615 TaxID=2975898 RepID=UPI003863BF24
MAGGPAALAELLGQVAGGEAPTSVELAELLWLAGHIAAPQEETGADPRAGEDAASARRPPAEASPQPGTPTQAPQDGPAEAPPAAAPHRPDERVPLRLPGTGSGTGDGDGDDASGDRRSGPYTTLLSPAPPMLPHPLALQRTLRPLKRRVPAPVGQELDEEATAHRIARLGAAPRWWVPVLRPATERWLTLHLVYDAGPTMPVWRPLVRELHTALAQSGVFRTVELHRLTVDGTVRRPGSQESSADGRTVTLLVSDCMGPQWRSGPAGTRWYRTLRRWAARMPVAVLQPLPERLWRTTALPATTARIAAPWPAAPNSTYTVDSYATDDLPAPGRLPLPVLEPSAPWLANWSSLVAGASPLPGSVALLDFAPAPAPVDDLGRGDVEQLSPEELVLRFRSLASPEAFLLAGHLAVGRPELPVMRLVQAAIERNPQPQHLAEVILSGVLSSTPGAPGSYAFRPGVRELLLHTLPRTAHSRTAELLGRVGALIDARAGVAAGEFPVLAPGGGDATAGGEPFAAVREESVRRLGGGPPPKPDGLVSRRTSRYPPSASSPGFGELVLGRYRLVRRPGRGRQVTRAEDTQSDRTVAVHEYASVRPAHHQAFLDDARALAAVEHPNVLAVYDFGIDGGIPYLVTEFVDGFTVRELTAEGGFRMPFPLLAPLAQQVAGGLKAVHERGIAHGRLTPGSWLTAGPDATVKITSFALGTERDRSESKDLRDFGYLLRELSGERRPVLSEVPSAFRRLFDDAITPLTSSDPAAQRRGRDLFLTPSFDQVLEAVTAGRYFYRLLGSQRISEGDRRLPDGSPQEQALLCMLLLRPARTVTYEELTQGIWGQHPPERPEWLLSSYASGLRKILGPGVLATTADGYALHAAESDVDLYHHTVLVERSKSLRDAGDPRAARDAIQAALDLWFIEPLAGVPGPSARGTRARLLPLLQKARALCAELHLELGDFDQAATDLDALLQEAPEREEFRRLHALAVQRRQRERPTILVEYAEPDVLPHTHSIVGRTVSWLLALSGMTPHEYELISRDSGYLVLTEPETSLLTALHAVLRELPGALLELEDPPKLRVTFWDTPRFTRADRTTTPLDLLPAPERFSADVVLFLSPVVHQELASGAIAIDPALFQPLHRRFLDPPFAWYCTLDLPERAPEPEPVQRDLVRGPFTIRDTSRIIRIPEQGRTAVVHTEPDNSLALLNPNRPLAKRPPRSLITYYEVDLTTHGATHELLLPSSGRKTFAASAELSWHVDDPVAFVRGETADVSGQLLDHLVREAGRITRRYPLGRGGAAQRAVHEGLRRWPVPGLSVSCAVRLREGTPPPQAPSPDPARNPVKRRAEARQRSLAATLEGAECVLLGFDGTLTRLWSGVAPDRVAHELAALLVELRSPDEALSGEPLLADGAPSALVDGYTNPLDLLRAFAHHRLGAELRRELDRIESQAVPLAAPIPHADALIRTLAAGGRGPAVVADTSPRAVTSYLETRGLANAVTGGVHARADDLTLLMPNPDCLHRALNELGVSAAQAVLIGSTVTELTAANTIGLPFIGSADNEQTEQRLRRAGCEQTVPSLELVLEAIRTA